MEVKLEIMGEIIEGVVTGISTDISDGNICTIVFPDNPGVTELTVKVKNSTAQKLIEEIQRVHKP